MPPELIRQVAQALLVHPDAGMATLAQCIRSVEELADPAAVKVVTDREGYALYFSRAPIPVARDGDAAGWLARGATPWRRHLGIYAYRAGFLARYVAWPVTEIEQIEALEQLRALWHGARIHVSESCVPAAQGVDTPADLARVRALLEAGA